MTKPGRKLPADSTTVLVLGELVNALEQESKWLRASRSPPLHQRLARELRSHTARQPRPARTPPGGAPHVKPTGALTSGSTIRHRPAAACRGALMTCPDSAAKGAPATQPA